MNENGSADGNNDRTGSSLILPSGQPIRKEKLTEKLSIPEPLKILAITALGYGCVFAYEAGFCRFFHIPITLIQIDVTSFLVYGAGALSVIALLFQFFHILCTVGEMSKELWRKSPVLHWLVLNIPQLVLLTIIAILEGFKGASFYLLACLTLLHFGKHLVPPFLSMRYDERKRGYIYHFMNYKHLWNTDGEDAVWKLARKEGFLIPLTILGGIGFCLYFSNAVGGYIAARTEQFLQSESSTNEFVLRVYGRTAIMARIDENRIIYPDFTLVKIDEQTNGFRLVKIGKLTPALPLDLTKLPKPVSTNTAKSLVAPSNSIGSLVSEPTNVFQIPTENAPTDKLTNNTLTEGSQRDD